MILCWFDAIV